MARLAIFLLAVATALASTWCADPPTDGQLVIDIDRVALRAGVSELSLTATDLRLFYNEAPSVSRDHVDCTAGTGVNFAATPITLDLTSTGRTFVAATNAPAGALREIWLVFSSIPHVTENNLSKPLHPALHCTNGAGDVIRLTSGDPGGVQVRTNEATEIAARFDPNVDLSHKDVDKGNGDTTGDIRGGRWSLTDSVDFFQVITNAIVDGQIVVRFKDGTSSSDIANAIAAQSLTVLYKVESHNYYTLQTPNGADEIAIIKYYAGLGIVEYVSPNSYLTPSFSFDPQFLSQVQWPQVGLKEVCTKNQPLTCDGKPDPNSTDAWALTTGSFENVVAVIDAGFDLTNPDIISNLFINVAEIPQEILNRVGNLNGDSVTDWRDLDNSPPGGDGFITFADLDATDHICETLVGPAPLHTKCPGGVKAACKDLPCTPASLVTGAGVPDPGTCVQSPSPLNGSWEDGADADCNGFIDDIIGWNFDGRDSKGNPIVRDGWTGNNKIVPFLDITSPTQDALTPTTFLEHGATVASIIGAAGANGTDTAGVNWKVRLLPIQTRTKQIETATPGQAKVEVFRDSVFHAGLYASLMKSDVVNISMGGVALLDGSLKNALGSLGHCPTDLTAAFPATNKAQAYAFFADKLRQEASELQSVFQSSKTLVVMSAGNCGVNLDSADIIEYPQAMKGSNVLVVASSGTVSPFGEVGRSNTDELSVFSNYGLGANCSTTGMCLTDIAAPGEFFVVASIDKNKLQYAGASTFCGSSQGTNRDWYSVEEQRYGGFATGKGCQGTSFSAPMVAGAAALLLAHDGTLKGKPCDIADRILRNADTGLTNACASDPDLCLDGKIGGGRRLNITNALIDSSSSHIRSCP